MNLLRLVLDVGLLLIRQISNELGRIATPLLSGGDARVRGDDRSGFQDGVGLHNGALHYCALLSDVDEVLHSAGDQDRSGPDADIVPNVANWREPRLHGIHAGREGVDDGSVLNVGREADGDGVARIGPNDGTVPDRGLVPVRNVPNYRCRRGNESIVRLEGLGAIEHHVGTVSGENLWYRRVECVCADSIRCRTGERAWDAGSRNGK
mmetsp:Transcript_34055/g.100324  ORF Transcript_34055/g.100324 Transcript_34055/m.100324 type:complete len:208 (-) Transcript_34055:228-851(-)